MSSSTEAPPCVYCVVGYPGAGKSTVEELASDEGHTTIQMGAEVKRRARAEMGDEATSDDIGEWATEQREINGETVVARWTAERLNELETTPVMVIDGVRSVDELEVFEKRFENVEVVYVSTDFDERLRRLQERGRDGEDKFEVSDLERRDAREDSWGVANLLDEVEYTEIENNGTFEEFKNAVSADLF